MQFFLFCFFFVLFWQTTNDQENTAYTCTHKHTLAICFVSVVKDNDMLKLNEPTHIHA